MITGIALFGVLTANLAAFVLERVPEENEPDKLDEILRRLTMLEEQLRRSD